MIWRHHYSLLVSAAVTLILVVTRPDFVAWHLFPPVALWGGGHLIVIKIERQYMSPERAALKEQLKMEEMREKHKKKMWSSWGTRHFGALYGVGVVVFLAVIVGAYVLGNLGPEGIQEWLDLLGCRCG